MRRLRSFRSPRTEKVSFATYKGMSLIAHRSSLIDDRAGACATFCMPFFFHSNCNRSHVGYKQTPLSKATNWLWHFLQTAPIFLPKHHTIILMHSRSTRFCSLSITASAASAFLGFTVIHGKSRSHSRYRLTSRRSRLVDWPRRELAPDLCQAQRVVTQRRHCGCGSMREPQQAVRHQQ